MADATGHPIDRVWEHRATAKRYLPAGTTKGSTWCQDPVPGWDLGPWRPSSRDLHEPSALLFDPVPLTIRTCGCQGLARTCLAATSTTIEVPKTGEGCTTGSDRLRGGE